MAMRRRHGSGGDDDGKGFLSRWSERKRAAEAGALPEEAERDLETAAPEAAGAQQLPDAAAEDAALAELPDIDSLEAGADFSVFMKQGVPAALQRRALRRLWQVDPAFNEICMLDDYNLDYTDAAMVVPNLKTSYQVGRGMMLPEELEAELKAAAERVGAPEGDETAALTPPEAAPPQEEGAPPAVPDAAASAAAPAAALPASSRPEPRKPGTPRVKAAPTPSVVARRPGDGGAPRSARQKRWGDSDA